jgi:predicted metalloprotease with PDZ domain
VAAVAATTPEDTNEAADSAAAVAATTAEDKNAAAEFTAAVDDVDKGGNVAVAPAVTAAQAAAAALPKGAPGVFQVSTITVTTPNDMVFGASVHLNTDGLFVVGDLCWGGCAQQAGLLSGDQVCKINGSTVTDVDQAKMLILTAEDAVELEILRQAVPENTNMYQVGNGAHFRYGMNGNEKALPPTSDVPIRYYLVIEKISTLEKVKCGATVFLHEG